MGGYVAFSGTTGINRSLNAPDAPADGTWVTLGTIPANPRRNFIEVQNQGATLVQIVRDDGNGGNQTSIFLSAAPTEPGQGASWTSATFKGRLTIYGPLNAPIGAYED